MQFSSVFALLGPNQTGIHQRVTGSHFALFLDLLCQNFFKVEYLCSMPSFLQTSTKDHEYVYNMLGFHHFNMTPNSPWARASSWYHSGKENASDI